MDFEESDPQRKRVYCWEEYLHDVLDISEDSLSLSQCREIVEEICLRHAFSPPVVKDGRGMRVASGCISRIHLPHLYRDPLSVVHETCHVLSSYTDPELAAHGPLFVRFFIMNLSRYVDGCSRKSLEKSALDFGLEVAPRTSCRVPPWNVVSSLLKQMMVFRGYARLVEEYSSVTKEMDRKANEAHNLLEVMRCRVQKSVWPKGLHPLVVECLKKEGMLP